MKRISLTVFRTALHSRIVVFNLWAMNYIRLDRRLILKQLVMQLSALFLRLFADQRSSQKYTQLAENLWMQGRHSRSLDYFLRADIVRKQRIQACQWEDKNFLLLPRNGVNIIGCMGHIDAFIKQKILNQDRREYYLLAPKHDIVNIDFLNYWSSYLTFVTDPKKIAEWAIYEPAFTENWNWAISQKPGHLLYAHDAMASIQQQWYQEGREPLLTLSEPHQVAVMQQRQQWGLTEEDWFVCLHIRSAGYWQHDGRSQNLRNTPIEDYYPLMNAIVERGGWVIRMGHPSAPRLDKQQLRHPRIIDYAHESCRSSLLDVGLSASCRLFITTNSGLHAVAKSFGVPSLHLNYQLIKGLPHYPNSLLMPCFYYSHKQHRVLTIEEVFSTLPYADHQIHLDMKQVSVRRVGPKDMILGLDEALFGISKDVGSDQAKVFGRLVKKYNMNINGHIPQAFVEKYQNVLNL